MILTIALNVRKVSVVALLSAIVATETFVSAGFLNTPSSSTRQHIDHPQQHYTESHCGFGRTIQKAKSLLPQKYEQVSTVIRGGGIDNDEQELKDCGGSVAGLFGNLRIPATLIAGASLASAFALPLTDTDNFKIGFAKRMYSLSMLTTLGSMLLVVILSTITMNDIALCPTRLSKSVSDYIDENYALEWMMARSHFFYGSLAFVAGTAFRASISIHCSVFSNGVVGILSSLTLMSMSHLMEKIRAQEAGKPVYKVLGQFLKEIAKKAKVNPLFGIGAIVWVTTVAYLLVNIPHVYTHMSAM